MATYKAIGRDNVNIIEDSYQSSYYTIDAEYLRVYNVPAKNDPNFVNNGVAHVLGGLVGLYSDAIADKYDQIYTEGGFKYTALDQGNGDGIYSSYYTYGGIFGSISNEAYPKSLMGGDISLKLPITGGTGGLSGLTAVTLYTAFFNQPNALDIKKDSECGGAIFDCQRFETLPDATMKTGIAWEGKNSCITYLFADELSFTTGSTTGNSFTTGHMSNAPYLRGKKYKPDFYRDQAVGVLNCCSGNFYLWNQHIVNSFNYGIAASGGTGTTGYVFNSGDLYMNTRSYDSWAGIQLKIIASPEEFTIAGSRNPSKNQAILDGLDCGDVSYITGICITDNTGEIVAVAKVDEPVEKTKDGYAIFNLIATIDGGKQDNPLEDAGVIY